MVLMKRNLLGGKKLFFLFFLLVIIVTAFFAPFGLFSGTRTTAAGTISGRVFQDFNSNGNYDNTGGVTANPTAIDRGVAGVTVTAFDSAGVQRGTTVTVANGTYSLAAAGTGPYRVEFTNLPAGYSPSARSNDSVGAGTASNSGSTVFFVNDGNTANVNLAINRPEEYCQNNPDMVVCKFAEGASNGVFGGNSAVLEFPFWAGTVYSDPTETNYDPPVNHLVDIKVSRIGTTFSLAYAPSTKRVYAASYFKRHAGFGPGADLILNNSDDPGSIYVIDPSTSSVVNTFTVPGATTNSHDTTNYGEDNLDVGWNAVGRTSLGGMDMADDESRLFVMNLENRTLYALNPLTGVVLGSQAVPTSGLPTPGGTAANCPASDVRPFAVTYYRQNVYVGMICSAESTQNTSNLRAYVFQVNPTTLAFGGSPIFQFALNYPRGSADPGWPAAWNPWITTISANFAYPQPLFTDIAFQDGNMVIGIRDKTGDSAVDFGPNGKRTGGDTLRACGTVGSWVLESNGRCGGTGNAPQGTGQGPGNGEFYYQDDFSNPANSANFHDEVSWGTLANVPGTNYVLTTLLDPISRTIVSGATFDGGFRWLNSTTGASDRAYRIYNGDGSNNVPDFGKANGLGDLKALCDKAPIEIGNRVWVDANRNGIQDPNETPIQNVSLQLWADTDNNGSVDTQVGTATTNANGHYVFNAGNLISSSACGTTFRTVASRVNASSDDAEQDQSDGSVSLTSGDLDLLSNEGAPPNYSAVGVRFNNLNIPNGATITNAYIEFTANETTVSGGNPTILIDGQAADNPGTFTSATNNISTRPRTTLAQRVSWNPPTWADNSLQQTANLSGIVQEIVNRGGWASGNSMVFIFSGSDFTSYREAESYDGDPLQAPRLVVQYSSPSQCLIQMNTNYEIRIPSSNFSGGALTGLTPTSPDSDGTANGDSRDSDGIVLSGSQVVKPLTTGGGGANDHTYDFGFNSAASGYSIGNRVWYDTNNDGRINAAEVGIGGISVSLFADTNLDGQPDNPASPVGTLMTDSNGYYRFDNLSSGSFVVRINPANFAGGATLSGYQNTTGSNNGDVDSDATNGGENGIEPTGAANSVLTAGILSNTVTLGPGAIEPVSEADLSPTGQGTLDNQADMTVDFGFYCLSLSGTLWNDTGAGADNNDGQLDTGETVIPNIRVRLFDSSGNDVPVGPDGILGTSDDNLLGVNSDVNGNYNFRCLPVGQYRVVVGGNSGVSSTPTSNNPDDNVDSDDNGFPGTGQFNGRTISNLVTLTPGSTGAQGNNTVNNSAGTTADPTVDFGFIVAPTFVKLESFDVFADTSGVTIKWSTAEEFNNLGFNVYRENAGQRELLNPSPIAGNTLRSTVNLVATGEDYQWFDDRPQEPGTVYYLEDVDIKGKGTMHGPVAPLLRFSAGNLRSNSALLKELAKVIRPSAEREFLSRSGTPNNSGRRVSAENETRQWEIAAKPGVKISVDHEGWYRVGAAQLQAAGFDTVSDRTGWQLFADGLEVPIRVLTDGSIEFFGRGLDTPTADKQVYYLIKGNVQGLRIGAVSGVPVGDSPSVSAFPITVRRKDRVSYLSSVLNGEAENWFGPFVTPNGATDQDLTVYNPDGNGAAALSVSLQGLTSGGHQVRIRFNQTDLGVVELNEQENRAFDFQIPASALIAGQNRVVLQSVGSGNDISLVDTVSLTYQRRYVAVNDRIHFTVPAGQGVQVRGFTQGEIDLFEIRNGQVERQILSAAEKVEGTHGISLSPTGFSRELIAVDRASAETVAGVERNVPSSWNRPENRADFVIIAPQQFSDQAEQLARLRRAQGLDTKVVQVADLYDEFSYGTHSPNAIRRFFEVAAATWQLKPKYALLFGDSSYDPRNYAGQIDRDLVPTKLIDTEFMETSSDTWLADFNDDGIEDISLGRLPAVNPAEASVLVAKTIQYSNQPAQPVGSDLLIADRGFENYNGILQGDLPGDVQISRIERSALGDAQMRQAIINGLNSGPTVATYTGHGSTGLWASADVFTLNDVSALNNNRLSFYLMMTCLNGLTNNPFGGSLAEAAILKEDGGAALVWASSGTTYPDKQFEMTRNLTGFIFNGKGAVYRAGDIVRATKQATADQDVRRTWLLIGDPTALVK